MKNSDALTLLKNMTEYIEYSLDEIAELKTDNGELSDFFAGEMQAYFECLEFIAAHTGGDMKALSERENAYGIK